MKRSPRRVRRFSDRYAWAGRELVVDGSLMKELCVDDAIAPSAERFEDPLSDEALDLARNNFANRAQLLGQSLLRHA